jgi:flagellar M-ring protein FliF
VVRQERSAVGKRDTEFEYWGSTVKSARVAVGIPMSHFEKIWRKDNPTPPGETSKTPQPADLEPIRKAEIAKARETVEKLIPLPDGAADASKLVDVHDYSDIPEDPLPEPRMQQRAVEWLGRHWSTLGLGFLVLISLLMLRSMVRAAPGLPPRAPQATSAAAVAGQEEETRKKEEVPAQRRLRRLTGTGTTLRDELSDLVSEDPDTAANILRTWIGNVS